ncbi:hypothetical protein GCM10010124_25270 [Pilimelia terevasa]|uniref:Uncharacterized protein n=1 Tax=Pilimelia terevasa TaxID=53372 RepID=A0A8J3BLQ6_9ACTN|nr:hypothetical protein [Pilimelia terevasa]GGK31443.1 hypothetical protein GCM10010124_25270 [Pilimelia terevasa]
MFNHPEPTATPAVVVPEALAKVLQQAWAQATHTDTSPQRWTADTVRALAGHLDDPIRNAQRLHDGLDNLRRTIHTQIHDAVTEHHADYQWAQGFLQACRAEPLRSRYRVVVEIVFEIDADAESIDSAEDDAREQLVSALRLSKVANSYLRPETEITVRKVDRGDLVHPNTYL